MSRELLEAIGYGIGSVGSIAGLIAIVRSIRSHQGRTLAILGTAIAVAIIAGTFFVSRPLTPVQSQGNDSNSHIIPTPTPTPTLEPTKPPQGSHPQYPQLHSSYRGTISDNTGVGNMQIDGLGQYSNGTFDAYGMLGSKYGNCYITISGSVSPGGTITFESYQQPNIENSCEAVTAHYTGEVNSDGSNPRGRWSVTSSGQTGQWNLS
jgi:hypothetical protein